MNKDKHLENKKEDRKALKKFFVVMFLSVIVGMICGIFSGAFRLSETKLWNVEEIKDFGRYACSISIYVVTLIAGIITAILYHKGKTMYASWDQEDEEVIGKIELKFSVAMLINSLMIIITYLIFTLGAYIMITERMQGQKINLILFTVLIAGFVVAMTYYTIVQQKIVNFEKVMNPEKKGSVFDTKFQKKWLEGCDEAERLTIYKSAYNTYRVMNYIFSVAWLISIIAIIALNTGVFASVMVLILWAIMTTVYSAQSIYLSKHPLENGNR